MGAILSVSMGKGRWLDNAADEACSIGDHCKVSSLVSSCERTALWPSSISMQLCSAH